MSEYEPRISSAKARLSEASRSKPVLIDKRERLMKFYEGFMTEMLEITKKKNNDYAGASEDPFFNFTLVEYLGVVTTEQGMFTRLIDKVSRFATFLKTRDLMVKSESVTDTLMDLANYCILTAAYLELKKVEEDKNAGQ